VIPTYGIAGTVTAQSGMSGPLNLSRGLAGAIKAASEMSGRPSVIWAFAAEIAAQSGMAGYLDMAPAELVGVMPAQSCISGALTPVRGLAGTVTAQSDMSGALIHVFGLAAAIAAQSGLSGMLARIAGLAGRTDGRSFLADAQLLRVWLPFISLPDPAGDARRISWNANEPVLVLLDGELYQEVADAYLDLDRSQVIRQFLDVVDELPDGPWSPLDRVALTWSGDALSYQLWRKLGAGDWSQIAETNLLEYTDGPLVDGAWHYKVVAVDAEGDTAESAVADATVSSAPEPPSGLAFSWDADTKTLTLSWSASPSSDVATYRVRASNGEEALLLSSAPVQDSEDLEYQQVFTDETGMFIFSVCAVDSDGNEEANISQVVAIPFENGAPAARPAEPRLVEARAIAGGRIEVRWLYDPAFEYLGPGAAHEARVYWDAGTGAVDLSAPHAIVPMNHPAKASRYTWQSAPLTDGQAYRFVVRVATAPWPAGIETQNTDEHVAIPDTSVPTAPALAAQVL
jgi:hypothetical protein